jgi:hypothetical protein
LKRTCDYTADSRTLRTVGVGQKIPRCQPDR